MESESHDLSAEDKRSLDRTSHDIDHCDARHQWSAVNRRFPPQDQLPLRCRTVWRLIHDHNEESETQAIG